MFPFPMFWLLLCGKDAAVLPNLKLHGVAPPWPPSSSDSPFLLPSRPLPCSLSPRTTSAENLPCTGWGPEAVQIGGSSSSQGRRGALTQLVHGTAVFLVEGQLHHGAGGLADRSLIHVMISLTSVFGLEGNIESPTDCCKYPDGSEVHIIMNR